MSARMLMLLLAGAAAAQDSKPDDPLQVEERTPAGELQARYRVDEQRRKHGAFTAWHDNGLIAERAWFIAGVLDGLHETFWPNGKPRRSEVWRAGALDGKSVERSADGTHEVRFPYVKGKPHGRVEIVDKGKVTGTQEWKDGSITTLDGFAVHPRPKEAIEKSLATIYGADDPHGDHVPDTPEGALCVLKAYRYLCDLPWADLELDPKMNTACAAAANLCKRIGHLDHKPPNPGLPEAEYKLAFLGTSSSNLSVGADLPGSVHSYMDDSDPGNIDRVGHRRWCLNPELKRTGFGKDHEFSAMWSFDKSRTKVPDYEAVLYPPAGFVPVRYFGARHAFSVHLNPSKFRAPSAFDIEATVTPLDDRYLREGPGLPIEHQKANDSGAGIPFCVIFRPVGLAVAPGARYLAEVKFQKDKAVRQSLRWVVEFY
jgi:hypothetical protein